MDETELLDACRRGDRRAQRQLYERYAERIYRLTLRLSGNAHDAFDLSQETFVRAFQGLALFDGRSGVGTWLYRIATNEALQLFRRRATERRHLREYAAQGADTTDPESDSARREVQEALDRLAHPHRVVLLLKYQEGLSYEEIAAILECPAGTVASRLNRARTELRAMMEGQSPPAVEESDGLLHQTE
jgi:RNA polymerase sigma-70 factor (ECF subfamily)